MSSFYGRVLTVMLSCHQRHEARALTIPQLTAAGLRPLVIYDQCEPGRHKGNKQVGGDAVRFAAALDLPLLVVEDDIDLAPDFPQALEMALSMPREEPVYFYLNESVSHENRVASIYGPEIDEAIRAGSPLPLRLLPARTYIGLFGTQCVLIPPSLAGDVLRRIDAVRVAFDAALQTAIKSRYPPAYVVVPNVVQHRHDRTGREADHSVKRSLSFDCPREVRDGVAA